MNHEALLAELTLEEKIDLCHAQDKFSVAPIPRLGIESLVTSDGPNGIREEQAADEWRGLGREEDKATYLPAETVLAATWNAELCKLQGQVLAEEALYRGKDVVLAPGINIIRTPLGGRNFEYISEDPYLTAAIAVPYILGIQENDVAACVKHYALNNQETNRGEVNIEVSRRALYEIYLKGFKAAVKDADVACVMGAYNCYRNQHCCHNQHLVNDVLKGELGFQGVFMSDWAGTKDTREALYNGLDLEMGSERGSHRNDHMADALLELVRSNPNLTPLVDDKVRRSLRLHDRLHKGSALRKKGSFNTPEHQHVAYTVAAEGIIMLKNDDLLPIKDSTAHILVTGPNADLHQSNGGGSSAIAAFYEITPLKGIQNRFPNATIEYIDSQDIIQLEISARKADWVIYCGGLNHDLGFDCENEDKANMKLPSNQDLEISTVLSSNPNTVVLMTCGSPVEMPWISQARAVLWTGYAGMEFGNALADILLGVVNPSGKLTYTLPRHLEDHPSTRYGGYSFENNIYKDDIFVGYRGYDRDHIDPLFCFGHGLHYGSVDYQALVCQQDEAGIQATFRLTNTGSQPIKETAQLYIGHPGYIADRPPRELKAFSKVLLLPGESKEVSLHIPMEELDIYDEREGCFRFYDGDYQIFVGASSRDLPLSTILNIASR